MRKHKQLPYVLWQLALWVLFNKRADKEEDENKRLIVLEHQHAAIPFIEELLSQEEAAVTRLEAGMAQEESDEVRLRGSNICSSFRGVA